MFLTPKELNAFYNVFLNIPNGISNTVAVGNFGCCRLYESSLESFVCLCVCVFDIA